MQKKKQKQNPIIEAVKRYGLFSSWLHPLSFFQQCNYILYFFFFWCDVLPSIMECVFSIMVTQVISLMLGIWIQKIHFSMENTKIPCVLGYHKEFFCKTFHCFCSFHSYTNMNDNSAIELTGNFRKKIWVLSRMFLLTSGRIMKVRVQSMFFPFVLFLKTWI